MCVHAHACACVFVKPPGSASRCVSVNTLDNLRKQTNEHICYRMCMYVRARVCLRVSVCSSRCCWYVVVSACTLDYVRKLTTERILMWGYVCLSGCVNTLVYASEYNYAWLCAWPNGRAYVWACLYVCVCLCVYAIMNVFLYHVATCVWVPCLVYVRAWDDRKNLCVRVCLNAIECICVCVCA